MKRAMIACALALPLGGCFAAASPPVDPGTGNPTGTINQVQTITQNFCRFVPAASIVLELIVQEDPQLRSAQQIAQAICAAVSGPPKAVVTKAGKTMVRPPMVRGIVITGRRV
jgi:hypothetical protein